jgi:hypothetical protein
MNKLLLSAVAALLHITPTVVLIKREDAVKRILPTATAFTAREVHLSRADAHRLHEVLNWGPTTRPDLYTGAGTAMPSARSSSCEWTAPRPDRGRGRLQPRGAITQVAVTKATTETKAYWRPYAPGCWTATSG